MTGERPDVERYVEQERAAILQRRARFIAWPRSRRLLLTTGCATLGLLPVAAFVALLARHDDGGPAAAIVVGVVTAVAVYAFATYYAFDPVRATGGMLRSAGSYPTRAPGYASPHENRPTDDS